MLPLLEAHAPSGAELGRAYRGEWPDAPELIPIACEDTGTLAFELAGTSVHVALVGSVIPWSDLEPACAAAYHWPEAKATLEPHVAHWIITASSEAADPIDVMLALTRVVAAALLSSRPAGVYWGAASLVNSGEAFLEEAREMSREYLPLYLWVRFGLVRNRGKKGDTFTLYTQGVDQFDSMEVEFPQSTLDPEALIDRAFNVVHHLLDHGPVLKDGDTIGLTTHERFLVSHQASIIDPTRSVYALSRARRR